MVPAGSRWEPGAFNGSDASEAGKVSEPSETCEPEVGMMAGAVIQECGQEKILVEQSKLYKWWERRSLSYEFACGSKWPEGLIQSSLTSMEILPFTSAGFTVSLSLSVLLLLSTLLMRVGKQGLLCISHRLVDIFYTWNHLFTISPTRFFSLSTLWLLW